MHELRLERPEDSELVAPKAIVVKKPWEAPRLDELLLRETQAALGGGLDGALAGTMTS